MTERTNTSDGRIFAPWTEEQVVALNRFQRSPMHPFTCGREHSYGHSTLYATPNGWECPDPRCGYTQNWAHAYMADPEWLTNQIDAMAQVKALFEAGR